MASKCTCFAVINDPVRKERFKDIFPNDEIPIKYPVYAGRAKTGVEEYLFYEIATTRITQEQKELTAQRLAPIFKLSPEEILKDFEDPNFTVPLKADGITVCFCPLHTRMLIA